MPAPADPPKVIVTLPQRVELWYSNGHGTKKLLFSHDELACPRTGIVKLADGFACALVDLRVAWGKPMKLNSACRSAAYNASIKGHPRSLHIYDAPQHGLNGTAAIDVSTPDASQAGALAFLAWQMGWAVGVGRGFLHLDQRALAGMPKVLFGY